MEDVMAKKEKKPPMVKTEEFGKTPRSYDQAPVVDVDQLIKWDEIASEIEPQLLIFKALMDVEKREKEEAVKLKGEIGMKLYGAVAPEDYHLPESEFQKGFFAKALSRLFTAGRDFIQGRFGSSTTIVAATIIGGGIGFVLGTFVLPGIGSAIGGAIGAAIGTGLAAIGGGVGLAVIGLFAGSWFGTKMPKWIFKKEKHFKPSVKVTDKIKKRFGIDAKTTKKMGAFLYNRAKHITDPSFKALYTKQRKGLEKGDPQSLAEIALTFGNEFLLLKNELVLATTDEQTRALELEIIEVKNILAALKNSKIPAAAKNFIRAALGERIVGMATPSAPGMAVPGMGMAPAAPGMGAPVPAQGVGASPIPVQGMGLPVPAQGMGATPGMGVAPGMGASGTGVAPDPDIHRRHKRAVSFSKGHHHKG
ncbi:MAG: hypothetical protein ACHQVK_01970, partial [Candidatus Paceibacterales bacterium]